MSDPIYVTAAQVKAMQPNVDRIERLMSCFDPVYTDDTRLPLTVIIDMDLPLDDVLCVLLRVNPRCLELWLCACLEATIRRVEDALPRFEAARPDDMRPRAAVEAAKSLVDCTKRCTSSSIYVDVRTQFGLFSETLRNASKSTNLVDEGPIRDVAYAAVGLLTAAIYASNRDYVFGAHSYAYGACAQAAQTSREEFKSEFRQFLRNFVSGDRDV